MLEQEIIHIQNEALKEYRDTLKKDGKILCDEIQNRLAEYSVINNYNNYFLEDILKILHSIVSNKNYITMCHTWTGEASFILENGAIGSEKIRAEANTFVNAAGKFVVEAIERGFVVTDWRDVLNKGLETSEYKVRSGLMLERNWIKTIIDNIPD